MVRYILLHYLSHDSLIGELPAVCRSQRATIEQPEVRGVEGKESCWPITIHACVMSGSYIISCIYKIMNITASKGVCQPLYWPKIWWAGVSTPGPHPSPLQNPTPPSSTPKPTNRKGNRQVTMYRYTLRKSPAQFLVWYIFPEAVDHLWEQNTTILRQHKAMQ